MQERRRRSGALHASTCEEYLKKYEIIGKMVLVESHRKKSQSHDSGFANFDYIQGEEVFPLDAASDEIIVRKVLLWSPKYRLNEDEFLSLMKKMRSRSVTTDGVLLKNNAIYDFDFFYREYLIAEKNYGLHFWVQNSNKHKFGEIFLRNYYPRFDAAILFQRDQELESVIKRLNPKCMIKFFPLMDELIIEPLQSMIIEICQLQS